MSQFFGKYRGTVANNVDPQLQGRVQVSCPAVLGQGSLSWALPCAPYAGNGVGIFFVPPVGANVWVEFEAGSPDQPIYSGGFWDMGQAPDPLALPTTKIIKTDGMSLKIDDLPGAGGVTLEVGPPVLPLQLRVALTATGIEIQNAQAKIVLSPVSVSINNGALEVI